MGGSDMEDAGNIVTGLSLLSFGAALIGPIITLVIIFGIIGAVRRRTNPAGSSPRPVASLVKWGCGLLALLPVSGFGGLMVATAGGALHPPLIMAAAPYVCDGTVELQSQSYSYKPGQRGVSRTFYCNHPDGSQSDITLASIGAATIYYSLIFLPFLLVASLLLGLLARNRLPKLSASIRAQNIDALRAQLGERLHVDADFVRRARDVPPDEGDVAARLARLQSLRDEGLISEAEYQAKRAEILTKL